MECVSSLVTLANIYRYFALVDKVPGTPEPDIRVRVRRCIVQIECEDARIRRIVPIAAAFESPDCL